ncbi:MAG TPA: hypothetical protein H9851_05215, partial [Candidatus Borkfalkia faecavium]|nr:hypothetical protein [Candidatus Borkfalkia faecavium]
SRLTLLITAAVRANGFFPCAFFPVKNISLFCLFSLDFYLQVLIFLIKPKQNEPAMKEPLSFGLVIIIQFLQKQSNIKRVFLLCFASKIKVRMYSLVQTFIIEHFSPTKNCGMHNACRSFFV